MINSARPVFCALLFFTSLSATVYAAEAVRQFDIELLIFQNLSADDGGEVWPIDYSEWFDDDSVEQGDPEPGKATRTSKRATRVIWLGRDALHLQAEQHALKRSGNYRPLRHLAWRQTVLDRNRAQEIEIPPSNAEGPVKIEGTVRVAVERYLHLYLDLKLIDTTLALKTGFSDYDLPEFRLQQRRRMRSKELHYFDHPKFGVIALITPYTPPADN
jgi:hypothetical protein